MWKVTVMTLCQVLAWPGGTEERKKKPQDSQSLKKLKYKHTVFT